jgi:hypothetical protein
MDERGRLENTPNSQEILTRYTSAMEKEKLGSLSSAGNPEETEDLAATEIEVPELSQEAQQKIRESLVGCWFHN